MTSTQVVEALVTTTDNSPSQDYTHSDNQTTLSQISSYSPAHVPIITKDKAWNSPET